MSAPESRQSLLARIASALDRLAPGAPNAVDLASFPAYVWGADGLRGLPQPPSPELEDFHGIDAQREALLVNSRRLAQGFAAHDVLLWGARGMGKSSLVRAVHRRVRSEGHDLALIQLDRDELPRLSALLRLLGAAPRRFLVYVDDLGFDADDGAIRPLRSLLEGGVEARPDNVRLVVTSNRRHLIPRAHPSEAAQAINPRDHLDEQLALSDRFGLSLGFHACDQATYLDIVAAYCARHGLDFEASEAIAWATVRGARSGRVARQYVDELAGRAGRTIS